MTVQSDYTYPVWGTQGGGLVREVNGQHVFVTKPDCVAYNVGDTMPPEWGLIPANAAARDVVDQIGWPDEDWIADCDAALKDYGLKGL